MSGDYTRLRFDPVKAFTGVLEQQGRVRLDAEFNDFVHMDDRRQRAEMQDIVGRCAVPKTTKDAFRVVLGGSSFTLGIGRAYVDGILVECRGDKPYDSFNASLGELYGTTPLPFEKQPFVYTKDLTVPDFPALAGSPSTNIVYLDVWQREVTCLEDADLKEQALGGPDTTVRVQTAWQVKVLANVKAASCDEAPKEWVDLVAPSTGRLTSAAPLPAPSPNPCIIEPEGGYTGLENRLYRIEIHEDGKVGGATPAKFKWSRDNASVAFGINKITKVPGPPVSTRVELTGIGRDNVMRLKKDEFVEVLDDDLEFSIRERHKGGHVAQITDVDEANATITLNIDLAAVFAVKPDRHPRLRRWDTVAGAANALADTKAGPATISIEEGINVSFGPNAAATLRAGDYWVFAARTATGTIEELQSAPPRGVLHHYCRLALVSGPAVQDCRIIWPPDLSCPECECTVCIGPKDNIQDAIDNKLPKEGGHLCLAAGTYVLSKPVMVPKRRRIVISGAGPSTILRATRSELAMAFLRCQEIEIRHVRVEGGPVGAPGDPSLNGALSFKECTDVRVLDCDVWCPDIREIGIRTQTCVTVVSNPKLLRDRALIEGNRFQVGAFQTGVLLVDVDRGTVKGNHVWYTSSQKEDSPTRAGGQGIVAGGSRIGTVEVLDNVVEDMIQGIHVGASERDQAGGKSSEKRDQADEVVISRNVVHALVPQGYQKERHGIFVGNARSIHILDTVATLRPPRGPNQKEASGVEGIRVFGVLGPFLTVRQSSLKDFTTGVRVQPLAPVPAAAHRMWLVAETMAAGSVVALVAPASVDRERNFQ
jgi:hypothetical protein